MPWNYTKQIYLARNVRVCVMMICSITVTLTPWWIIFSWCWSDAGEQASPLSYRQVSFLQGLVHLIDSSLFRKQHCCRPEAHNIKGQISDGEPGDLGEDDFFHQSVPGDGAHAVIGSDDDVHTVPLVVCFCGVSRWSGPPVWPSLCAQVIMGRTCVQCCQALQST